MGLDARALVLSEDLRIWHDLGLHHVLCEQDVAALRPVQAALRPGAQVEPPRAPRPRQGEERTPGAPAPPARRAADTSGPGQRPARAATPAPRPEAGTPAPEGTASGASASEGPLAVFPWEQFRPKLATPSRTVWTYWELGIDFGPQPDPERRALFRNIIKALQWPPNSVAFWPLSFEHQGRLLANKGTFLRGVGEAGAQTIVCFGQQAFTVLFPRQPYATGRHRLEARTVIVLPGPAQMLGGPPPAKRLTGHTLRGLGLSPGLAPCGAPWRRRHTAHAAPQGTGTGHHVPLCTARGRAAPTRACRTSIPLRAPTHSPRVSVRASATPPVPCSPARVFPEAGPGGPAAPRTRCRGQREEDPYRNAAPSRAQVPEPPPPR